ncbi:MAG: 2Fe-2S iron-sulfur cluster-binding protein [Coriobacteriia bacterium]|nr:2Fe-2S iron-sulfur cluster-binding protein [Coriobacteriia bacterium]
MEHQIEVIPTGEAFSCRDDEFVIEAMVREDCGPVHSGCFGGGCGVCKMRIVSGDYTIEKKMNRTYLKEQEQEKGAVLICCVKPRSDLKLTRFRRSDMV